MSAYSVAKFKDLIFSCSRFDFHIYRNEFKDKKKDWDICEGSFGVVKLDICIILIIISVII